MVKRTLATVLWFLAGWSAAGFLVFAFGLPGAVAPFVGMIAALFVAVDPLNGIWRRPTTQHNLLGPLGGSSPKLTQ